MAELTISSDEIRGALERYVSSYTPEVSREEVGIVSDAGDGIAHVEGLPSAMANELLEFEDGTLGVALNLDVREIGDVAAHVNLLQWVRGVTSSETTVRPRPTVIERAIVDKNARIGRDVRITPDGKAADMDGPNYYVRDGIVVVPKNAVIPSGSEI